MPRYLCWMLEYIIPPGHQKMRLDFDAVKRSYRYQLLLVQISGAFCQTQAFLPMAYSSPVRTRWGLPLIGFQIHLLKPQQAFPDLGTCELGFGCFSFEIVLQIFPLVDTLEISKETWGINPSSRSLFYAALVWCEMGCC